MLDNPNGSSSQSLVEQMREARQAEEPALEESTGGTEEVEDTSVEQESEVDVDDSSDVYEDTEEAEQETEAQTWTIKANGQDRELTDVEMREFASKGVDYTQKTMAHAENVKALETKNAQLDESIAALSSLIESKEQSIDWDDLAENDPSEYIKQERLQNERKAVLESEQGKRNEELIKQQNDYVASEVSKLQQVMGTSWTKEQQAKDFSAANEYLESLGVSQEESAKISDHRLWQVIFDAAQFKALEKTKTRVSEEVRKAPKSVKPGQRPKPSERAQDEALRKLQNASKRNQENAAVAYLQSKRKKGN
jgi:hypothetical protein